MKKTIHIIGCGGVAHHLLHPLLAIAEQKFHRPTIHLWDKDVFEKKNTGRQFLSHGYLDKPKVQAFHEHFSPMYRGEIVPHEQWFTRGCIEDEEPLILVMADNHAARRAARDAAIQLGGILISGANETEDGEAWMYLPEHRGTRADPWVRYPDLDGEAGIDPVASSAGCTGEEVIRDNPQLPAGNAMTSAFMLWIINANLCGRKTLHNPAEFRFTRTGVSSSSWKDFLTVAEPAE